MKQTKVYLVRHGESTYNVQAIVSGHVDPPLTDTGRKQAASTKLELKDVKFDVAYTSDLQRAKITGEIIYGKPIPTANLIRNLRERTFGSLEGKPEKYLIEGNEKRKNMSHDESWIFKHVPDMESDSELASRFISALESIAEDNLGKTILVVAHGGAIRVTLMKLQGLSYDALPLGSFKNAGYAELVYKNNNFKVVKVVGVHI